MLLSIFFASIILSIFFAFIILLMLNYLVLKWENERIDALASRANRVDESILNKSEMQRGFSSLDFKSMSKGFKNRSRALIVLDYDEYPEWFKSFLQTTSKFKKNSFKSTVDFFKYLVSLAHPAKTELTEEEEKEAKLKKKEIQKLVDKVAKDNPHFQTESEDILSLPYTPKKTKNNATIDLLSSKNNQDGSQFEKLEARILKKLKESGLDNYDIWMELGDLYVKYKEPEKAKEIYALILKNSKETQKEMARNRLIGI